MYEVWVVQTKYRAGSNFFLLSDTASLSALKKLVNQADGLRDTAD